MSSFRKNWQPIVNTLSDPGVCFNTGNVIATMSESWQAALVSASVASISATARYITERRNLGHEFHFKGALGKFFNRLSKNKGLSLITSGVLTLGASAVALIQNGSDDLAVIGSASMLACFGLVHSFRGVASDLREDSVLRHSLESSAFFMAASAYIIANPELPLFINASYIGIALLAAKMAFKREAAHGWQQPDIAFALTSFVSAGITFEHSPEVAAAFFLWASGYLSIRALNKKGGVYQVLSDISLTR